MKAWYAGVMSLLGCLGAAPAFAQGVVEQPIVNGSDAVIADHPWQVRIERSSDGKAFCGGSIVASDWVLTAQHCLGPLIEAAGPDGALPFDRVQIVAGSDLRSTRPFKRGVLRAEVFPGYDASTYRHDVALLQLDAPLPLEHPSIEAVEIATAEHVAAGLLDVGTWGTASGFGQVTPDGTFVSQLQEGPLQIVDGTSPDYPAHRFVSEDMLPTFGFAATCFGDSGGPFTVRGPGGVRVLAGVTSWTISNCTRGVSVFASVAHHARWILDVIGQDVGDPDWCAAMTCPAFEGDCDGDRECGPGLLCTQDVGPRYGQSSVTDVCLPPLGDAGFCTAAFPCRRGEGHCDGDSECASGLRCVDGGGYARRFGLPTTVDVCISPSDFCTTSERCSAGTGPCESSSECMPGLRCEEEPSLGVRMCKSVAPLQQRCIGLRSCGVGQGPCTVDMECHAGLSCRRDERLGYKTCQGRPWDLEPDLDWSR